MALVFFGCVGAILIGWAVMKAIELYGRGFRVQRAHLRAMIDIGESAHALVDAHVQVAMCEARLAADVEKVPKEFGAAVRAILDRFARVKALHATTAEDAERVVVAALEATAKPVEEVAPASGERTKPSLVWVGGQLLPGSAVQ